MENNCTKILSSKNIQEITIIKGLCSGIICLIIAGILKFPMPNFKLILFILLIGFISYGLSVYLYICSQNKLGAAKTAGYFSFAPYIAAIISIVILGEIPDLKFF